MWEALTSFIPNILGYVMRFIHSFADSYWLTLFLFTLFTKVVLFPLMIKQQKSSARMAAYQPMINEINKTYANDKQKQQEEYQKFQQEYGFSPMAGCLPLLIQLPILYGLIDVVYKPLTHIIGLSKTIIAEAMTLEGLTVNRMGENALIRVIQESPDKFKTLFTPTELAKITSLDFSFFGMNLTDIPNISVVSLLWLIPVFSCGTMILSQIITSKMSGQEMKGSMKYMPYMMSLMFLWFAFTMPAGVSFYWIFSNVFGILQSLILKRMYDPNILKEQVAAEIEEKRKSKRVKKTKTVKIETEDGNVIEKAVSQTELEKIRLQKAREAAHNKYGD